MSKIKDYVSSNKQRHVHQDIDHFEAHNYIDQPSLDQQMFEQDMRPDQPEIDFSLDSEPIFRVEKVCRKQSSHHLFSSDIDSASEDISSLASVKNFDYDLDEDIEMVVEQEPFPLIQNESQCNDETNGVYLWPGTHPTHSCTNSIVG
jgi:hypothetical protein